MLRLAVSILALCLSVGAFSIFAGEDGDPTVPVGAVAPEISGKVWVTEDGKPPEYKGKVYLVDFWFANCASCVEAMPTLNKLAKKYEGKDFLILGLSTDPLSVVKLTKDKHNLKYPLLTDSKPSEKAWKIEFFPSLFLVGKDGKVKWKGDAMDKKLPEIIDAELAK